MFGTRNRARIDDIQIHGFIRKLPVLCELLAQLIRLLRKVDIHQSSYKMDSSFPTISC